MMIRVSRGKVIVYSRPFEVPFEDRLLSEPEYGAGVRRAVYVLAFEEGEFLTERVKKLASSFKDTKVASSETYEIKIESLYNDLNMYIAQREDCQRLIKSSRKVQRDLLRQIDVNDKALGVSAMEVYRLFIAREKLIHEQMNKFLRLSSSA